MNCDWEVDGPYEDALVVAQRIVCDRLAGRTPQAVPTYLERYAPTLACNLRWLSEDKPHAAIVHEIRKEIANLSRKLMRDKESF